MAELPAPTEGFVLTHVRDPDGHPIEVGQTTRR
jgi:hypothetical protein